MKKYILVSMFVLFPFVTHGSIDNDLKYGSTGPEVTELQEFLVEIGYLKTQPTGNFYSLTLAAVKRFQFFEGLPMTGYVGPLTRGKINSYLTDIISTTEDATTTTKTFPTPTQTPVATTTPTPTPTNTSGTGSPSEPAPTPIAPIITKPMETTVTVSGKKCVVDKKYYGDENPRPYYSVDITGPFMYVFRQATATHVDGSTTGYNLEANRRNANESVNVDFTDLTVGDTIAYTITVKDRQDGNIVATADGSFSVEGCQ